MAITERPKKQPKETPNAEKKAREIISRGMSSPSEDPSQEKPVTFRLTQDVIDRIDNARKARRVKTSKQSWFVEAILDKLESEGF